MSKIKILLGCLIAILCWSTQSLKAQSIKVKGRVSTQVGNDPIPYATIQFPALKTGTTADIDGLFSFEAPIGNFPLYVSMLGFESLDTLLSLKGDTELDLRLKEHIELLESVEIEADKEEDFIKNGLEKIKLKMEDANLLPALGGEKDIIMVAKLLPGISKGLEAGADMFVRGGDSDQNLVLLDQAVVYNPSHLLSFVSVFNSDIVEHAKIEKGGFHSKYGNRLASVLDIKTISPQKEDYTVKGGIGLVSSRLSLRHSFWKRKLNLQLAYRRTYIDQVIKLLDQEIPYYFQDINGIVEFIPSEKDRIKLSAFTSQDVLKAYDDGTKTNFHSNFLFVNSVQSIDWTHMHSPKTFSNLIASSSLYRYKTWVQYEDSNIDQKSRLNDLSLSYHLNHQNNSKLKTDYGFAIKLYQFQPNETESSGRLSPFVPDNEKSKLYNIENVLYFHLNYIFNPKLFISSGLRISSSAVRDQFYVGLEPRVNVGYQFDTNLNISASYSRMRQYIHRVASSELTLPTDLWYPVTKNVKPQIADQITIGSQLKIPSIQTILNLGLYFKNMNNLIDYKDGTDLTFNDNYEEDLIQGWGMAYGLESLIKKEGKKFSSWIAYTLSWTDRKFDEINLGKKFPARYDRRHNIALTTIYKIHRRWAISAVWEFQSGAKFTPLVGKYLTFSPGPGGLQTVSIYSDKNAINLPDAHRLDLSLTYYTRPNRKIKGEWSLSIYNVYNRPMPYTINIKKRPDGGYQYELPGLFGLIPSIAFNFEI